jgi:hypothetical protein
MTVSPCLDMATLSKGPTCVSVYNVYITNQFLTTFAQGGGEIRK